MEDNFLTQLVSEPIQERSLLDLFTTRGLARTVKVGSCLGNSEMAHSTNIVLTLLFEYNFVVFF